MFRDIVDMERCGPAINEADIERIEGTLGVRFPEDYRSFLLELNGGVPGRRNASFVFQQDGSTLRVLYGIHKERDTDDLEHKALLGRSGFLYMPETLVPIGADEGGDFICLGVAGNERGKVYFRDSERVPGEPPTKEWTKMKGIYRIADSFSEFLASLTPREDI